MVLLGNYRKMTLHKYYEIMRKYGLSNSHLPSNKQLARMSEDKLEKSCVAMVKLFDEVFKEKKGTKEEIHEI